MKSFEIIGISHRKREPSDFHMLRENGLPGFNFIHFIQPAVVTIDGIENITDNNACIIYTPGNRQEYKSYNDILINDYVVFHIDDPDFIIRFNLPLNEIFYIDNGDKITYMMESLSWAVTDKTEIRDSSEIFDGLKKLLTTLSSLRIDNNPVLKRAFETKQRFIALRDKMRENPAGWTIDKMAKQVWLTRSRFMVLYKSFFKVSPNADLMIIKIDYAKKLLQTTEMPIAEVSRICGYSSVEYFIKLFKKQAKYTPLQYRIAFKQSLSV